MTVTPLQIKRFTGNTSSNNVPNKRLLVGTFLCAVLGTLRSTFCVPDTVVDVPDIIWNILPNNIRHMKGRQNYGMLIAMDLKSKCRYESNSNFKCT